MYEVADWMLFHTINKCIIKSVAFLLSFMYEVDD